MKRLNLITETRRVGLQYGAELCLQRPEFFDGLGDTSAPGKDLSTAIARDFGSFETWRAEFIAMGKALGGDLGWVLLLYSPRDGTLVNQWAADHCHTLAGVRKTVIVRLRKHPVVVLAFALRLTPSRVRSQQLSQAKRRRIFWRVWPAWRLPTAWIAAHGRAPARAAKTRIENALKTALKPPMQHPPEGSREAQTTRQAVY